MQNIPDFDIYSYDYYIVNFSGGKDSTACFLYLLELGVPKKKIELWHQKIDGRERTFFDWEITPDYCRKFAEAFEVPIYFQWKQGGFKRELLRKNNLTAPACFELPDGTIENAGGKRGKLSTRRKFPQISADLSTRWCSAYLKIDVCSIAITNQERFRNKRTLVLSGERGEESIRRSRYAILEPDKADARESKLCRHVDRFRPVRDWREWQVWDIIEKYRIRVHPCYYMGWSRCSCKFCIFAGSPQYASAAMISPEQFEEIVRLEKDFNCTVKRKTDLKSFISGSVPFETITGELARLATGFEYNRAIILPPGEEWTLPGGAFGENGGPS